MSQNIVKINPSIGDNPTGVFYTGGKSTPLSSGCDYDFAIRNSTEFANCCDIGNGSVTISEDPGNVLEERDDGLYASPSGVVTATVSTVSTNCIDIAGDGTVGDPLVVVPIIDPDADNLLSCGSNGILALAGPFASVTVDDSSCINFSISGDGSSGDPYVISGSPNLSADAGNIIECRTDGLYVPSGTGGGSGIASVVTVSDTSCINLTISGDGSAGAPYDISAVPTISPDSDNVIECRANGFYVPSGMGAEIASINVSDTQSLDLTISGSGTSGNPYVISGDVILSSDLGNTLESRANGLYVPPASGSGGGGSTYVTVANPDAACVNLAISGAGSIGDPYSLSARLELDSSNPNILLCNESSGLRVEAPNLIQLGDRGTFTGDCNNYNDVKNYMTANYGDLTNVAFVYGDTVFGGVTNPHCAYVWAPGTTDELLRLNYTCPDTASVGDLGDLTALPTGVPFHVDQCPVHYFACLQGNFDLDTLAAPLTNLSKKDKITFASDGTFTFTSPCTGNVYVFNTDDLITLQWTGTRYFMS